MTRFSDVDRICIATLTGRFGVQLISSHGIQTAARPAAAARAIDILRTVAVWTNASRGFELGTV